MRSFLSRSLICLALATSVVWANAQDTPPPPPDGAQTQSQDGPPPPRRMDPDREIAHLTKRYNLTADQQTKIKAILTETQAQMQTLHSNTALSREERFTQMKSIHQSTTAKISSVLDDSQRAKYQADQAAREQHMHGPPQGGPDAGPGDGPRPGGPPPPDGGPMGLN